MHRRKQKARTRKLTQDLELQRDPVRPLPTIGYDGTNEIPNTDGLILGPITDTTSAGAFRRMCKKKEKRPTILTNTDGSILSDGKRITSYGSIDRDPSIVASEIARSPPEQVVCARSLSRRNSSVELPVAACELRQKAAHQASVKGKKPHIGSEVLDLGETPIQLQFSAPCSNTDNLDGVKIPIKKRVSNKIKSIIDPLRSPSRKNAPKEIRTEEVERN